MMMKMKKKKKNKIRRIINKIKPPFKVKIKKKKANQKLSTKETLYLMFNKNRTTINRKIKKKTK